MMDGEPKRRGVVLTSRQQEVLAFIERHIADHGYPPTTRELAAGCGLGAPSAAHRMIGILERKGYLTRTPGTKRAITITPPQIDPERLDSVLRGIIATAIGWQDVAVERSLEAAQEVRDPTIRSVLIRDALDRHELNQELCAAVADPGLGGSVAEELRWYRQRVPWSLFVVDHLVYNIAVSVGSRQFESQMPDLAQLWAHIGRLSDGASVVANVWLDSVLAEADGDETDRLRARGSYLLEMMVQVARRFGREDAFNAVVLPEDLRQSG